MQPTSPKEKTPLPMVQEGKFKVKESKSMKRFLNQLEVSCTYSEDGCRWRGYLGELQDHLNKTDHSSESLQHESTVDCMGNSQFVARMLQHKSP